jgi:hypothetical protein
MISQHSRSEALFYYFRLEDQVPENHLLRLIEKHISFAFVRERLKASYSEMGWIGTSSTRAKWRALRSARSNMLKKCLASPTLSERRFFTKNGIAAELPLFQARETSASAQHSSGSILVWKVFWPRCTPVQSMRMSTFLPTARISSGQGLLCLESV